MIHEVEHFFICFSAISITSVVKELFKSCAYFSIDCLFYLLLLLFLVYSRYESFVNIFLSLCALLLKA